MISQFLQGRSMISSPLTYGEYQPGNSVQWSRLCYLLPLLPVSLEAESKDFLKAKVIISFTCIFHFIHSSVDWLPILAHLWPKLQTKPQSLYKVSGQAHTINTLVFSQVGCKYRWQTCPIYSHGSVGQLGVS